MKVLVITGSNDPHIALVSSKMPNCEFLVFNPGEFSAKSEITYTWNGSTYTIDWKNNRLSTIDVDVVWYRKPVFLKPEDLHVPDKYKDFAYSAYKKTVTAIYGLLNDRYWVSPYFAIQKANNKLYQHEVAVAHGFKIPATIVTSNPLAAMQFFLKHGDIITKPLDQEFVNESGYVSAFYTTLIPKGSNPNFDGLRVSPAIFQQSLYKSIDIRVTVVGENVYPCEIRKVGEMNDAVDWRIGNLSANVKYSIHCGFPDQLRIMCVRMVKSLGLRYGAFDFMLSENGDYWFLEVNPNGQWGFVEIEGQLPISDGFVDLFTNRSF